jgi:hypothetical protein
MTCRPWSGPIADDYATTASAYYAAAARHGELSDVNRDGLCGGPCRGGAQRSTWYPDLHVPWGEWWLNPATILGWLLSSIFIVSLARLSRSP